MSAQSAIQKLQDELQRRFRVAGRGSVTRVQEKLSLGAGYFRDLRRPERQRLDLRVLLGALDELQVDNAEFFSSVFGPSDPVANFLSEAADIRRKMRRLPHILRQLSEIDVEALPSVGLDAAEIQRLDGIRRSNPRDAMRQIRSVLNQATEAQWPMLLGSYASACRIAGRLEDAQAILAVGLEWATEHHVLEVRADLIQRAAYIVADRTGHENALFLAEKATLSFAQLGDMVNVGKTLIDQGVFCGYLERREDACRFFKQGLKLLPEDVDGPVATNRAHALFNLALISMDLERLEDAQHFAALARRAMPCFGQLEVAKTLWLEASIARAQEQVVEAEAFLSESLDIFRELEPLTASLVAVELVRLQLVSGKPTHAYSTAKAMISLLKPLESNRIASAAITEMVRCALAGRGLTEKLLDHITTGLEGAKPSAQASR